MSFFQNLLGRKPAESPLPSPDSDFADFADAPPPSPVSILSSSASVPSEPTGINPGNVPYTRWYRIWERTQLSDFRNEFVLMPFILLAFVVHTWGVRKNRRNAKKWIAAHGPVLGSEFALVGYGNRTTELDGPFTAERLPANIMKERTIHDYQSYATGRQNIAWLDMKLHLFRLSNPPRMAVEWLLALFFDSYTPPRQIMDTSIYSFDGSEKKFVLPDVPGADEMTAKVDASAYDGFVFAIVHKTAMRRLREERYDVSLTYTKESAKLPVWATVMSEAAEITDTMLTKDLIHAVERAGEAFEYLIITDQPIEKPTKLEEATPRKRLFLRTRAPFNADYASTVSLFEAFLRLPDRLVQNAHFRPEIVKKLHQTREAEIKKLKRVGDEEAEEERRRLAEKAKKEERDRKTRGMTAEEQRKFLDKESERKRKKEEKKMTKKG